jgi:hypothetical protein
MLPRPKNAASKPECCQRTSSHPRQTVLTMVAPPPRTDPKIFPPLLEAKKLSTPTAHSHGSENFSRPSVDVWALRLDHADRPPARRRATSTHTGRALSASITRAGIW